MKSPWSPRFDGLAGWAALLLVSAAAAWVYPSAPSRSQRPPRQASAAPLADDPARIGQAIASLDALSRREPTWGAPDANRRRAAAGVDAAGADAPAGGDIADDPLLSPSPPPATATATPVDGPGRGRADGVPGLVLMQSGRRLGAWLDGKALHAGQSLPSGDTVVQIGTQAVVVKSPDGALRRIDMKARFMPRPAHPPTKENSP